MAHAISSRARLIKYYDHEGRKKFATKAQWCRSVLPRQLAQCRDDPRQLGRVIACAVEHGFSQDVLGAADRLLELDPETIRYHALKIRVLIGSGLHDQAESALREAIAAHGRNASLLTLQAKLHAARGEAGPCENVIKIALEADVNDRDALEFWRDHCERSKGPDGGVAALNHAAAMPGSWRAQLELARIGLRGDPQAVLNDYGTMLPFVTDNRDALEIIASDLREFGRFRELFDLIQPIYDPQRHGPWTGLHLLAACIHVRDPEVGQMILHSLFKLHRHELRHHLQSYANRFLIMAHETAIEERETFVLTEDG